MIRLTAKEAVKSAIAKTENIITARNTLQKMAEENKISPAEYWKALKMTFKMMTEGQKKKEFKACNI